MEYEYLEDEALPHCITLTLKSNNDNDWDLIYYETGFEGFFPIPPIWVWLEKVGDQNKDWKYTWIKPIKDVGARFQFARKDEAMRFKMAWG